MIFEPVQVKPYLSQSPTGQKQYGALGDPILAVVWPRFSDEIDAGGAVREGLNIYIPPQFQPEVGVNARDRLVVRGSEWDVDGVPGEFQTSSGEKTIITTKRVGT